VLSILEFRVLQCGIRVMSVLSGPALGDFTCCMQMELSYLRYLCCFLICCWVLCRIEMAGGSGRNNEVIADSLIAMAQVLAQVQKHGQPDQGEAEEQRLERFM